MLDLLEPFTEGPEEHDAFSSTPTVGGAAEHEVVEGKFLVINFLRLSSMREVQETTMCSLMIRKTPVVSFVSR